MKPGRETCRAFVTDDARNRRAQRMRLDLDMGLFCGFGQVGIERHTPFRMTMRISPYFSWRSSAMIRFSALVRRSSFCRSILRLLSPSDPKQKKPCATDLAARTKAYRTPVLFGCGDGASTGQHSAYLTDPSLPEGFTVTHSWGFAPRSACRINACARCPFLFCFVICLYYNKYAVGNQACKRDFHGKIRAHASLSCHVHFFDLVLALSN